MCIVKNFVLFCSRQETSKFVYVAESQLADFLPWKVTLTCVPISPTAFRWTPAVRGKMGVCLVACMCHTQRKACGCWLWACSATTPPVGGRCDARMDASQKQEFKMQAIWRLFVLFPWRYLPPCSLSPLSTFPCHSHMSLQVHLPVVEMLWFMFLTSLLFILFLCLFLSEWSFQLYFIP